jgi:hypothetical protein
MGCAWRFVPDPPLDTTKIERIRPLLRTRFALPRMRALYPLERLAGERRLFGAVEDLPHPVPFRFEFP